MIYIIYNNIKINVEIDLDYFQENTSNKNQRLYENIYYQMFLRHHYVKERGCYKNFLKENLP